MELEELQSREGEVLDRFRFEVSPSRVAAFSAALRAPGDSTEVPPTFLQAAALDRSVVPHLALGLDPARVRHADQSFRFFAPIRVGSVLDVSVRLEKAFERESASGHLLFVIVESDYRDGEDLVARSAATLVQLDG